jgi:FixJ family two-component response regulator
MNGRTRVALVDDDMSVRRGLARLLRSAGYDVEVYMTADSFLRSAAIESLDCALVDVRMTGETGLALARFLQIAGVSMPVILMTGDVDVVLTTKAARSGASALLGKPLTETAVIDAIEAAVGARKSAAAGRRDPE